MHSQKRTKANQDCETSYSLDRLSTTFNDSKKRMQGFSFLFSILFVMVTIACSWTNFFVAQSNNISEARKPQKLLWSFEFIN